MSWLRFGFGFPIMKDTVNIELILFLNPMDYIYSPWSEREIWQFCTLDNIHVYTLASI